VWLLDATLDLLSTNLSRPGCQYRRALLGLPERACRRPRDGGGVARNYGIRRPARERQLRERDCCFLTSLQPESAVGPGINSRGWRAAAMQCRAKHGLVLVYAESEWHCEDQHCRVDVRHGCSNLYRHGPESAHPGCMQR